MKYATERRSLHRHALRVPIQIEHVGSGMTRDVSANGVAFEIDAPLSLGSRIRFAIAFAEHALRLQCEGRVVRIDTSGGIALAAATIDFVDHLTGDSAPALPERRRRTSVRLSPKGG